MNLLWVGTECPANGSTIVAVHHGGTDYRYYHRTNTTGWQLIAVCDGHKAAEEWYCHRVTPTPVTAELAAWLTEEVAR